MTKKTSYLYKVHIMFFNDFPFLSVIVSQWTKMLDIVATHLTRLGVSHSLIQGNIQAKRRMEIVDDFNTNPRGARVGDISQLSHFLTIVSF